MLGAIALVVVIGLGAAVFATLIAFRADPVEREAAMPADALIQDPLFVTTQAVTVGDSPRGVWPWLAPYEPAPRSHPPGHLFLIEHAYAMLGHLPGPLLIAIAGLGHRVMQNRQLRGIPAATI